ncbi:hypothetical protein EV421DRAFT_153624 [Armillaria borealis]|uniref:Uncharacterized protein n=1 Tax=Armillaria borealis TaxID=47425 RepID=A0AA39JRZ2_9AGAR|nr:hypothetical protein EV421DRAFT_153624 [Armillaria borealis]
MESLSRFSVSLSMLASLSGPSVPVLCVEDCLATFNPVEYHASCESKVTVLSRMHIPLNRREHGREETNVGH